MDLTRTSELTIIDDAPESPPAGPRVALSTTVARHAGFVAVLRSVARLVPSATGDDVDVVIVHVDELAEVVGAPPLLAVGSEPDLAMMRRALAAGALGVVDWTTARSPLGAVVSAAAAGQATVPAGLVPGLLDRLEEPPADLDLLPADIELVNEVAEGLTLDELAALHACSTRTIRRELRAIWARLGVSGRAQGLVRATRWGLVTD